MGHDVRDLADALAAVDGHGQPHRLARVNDHGATVVTVLGEASVLLIEPAGTLSTGDAGGNRTPAVRDLP
jgi:hypothetical protein